MFVKTKRRVYPGLLVVFLGPPSSVSCLNTDPAAHGLSLNGSALEFEYSRVRTYSFHGAFLKWARPFPLCASSPI